MERHEDESSGHHGEHGEDHHAEDAATEADVHSSLQPFVFRISQNRFEQRVTAIVTKLAFVFSLSLSQFFLFERIQFFLVDDEAVKLHHGCAHDHEREAEDGKNDLKISQYKI